jgi:hypothetical protein
MKTSALAVVVVLAGVAPALAQEAPPPPKVLQIVHEQVKQGKSAAHEKVEVGWPRAFARVSFPDHYIAMTSVTGPGEAWFINAYDSFAAFEKSGDAIEKNAALKAELDALAAQDGELLTGGSSILAVHRDELSYRPNVDMSKMRFFSVTTTHVNPGRGQDFAAFRKVVNEAHAKANMDEHWAVYEVVSGASSGTYLIFQPLKSMADFDAYAQMHGKAYQEALGEENRGRIRDLQGGAVQSSSSQVFAFSPKMSYVSKEFASGDPDYWTPKPAAAAKVPAMKKEEKK